MLTKKAFHELMFFVSIVWTGICAIALVVGAIHPVGWIVGLIYNLSHAVWNRWLVQNRINW